MRAYLGLLRAVAGGGVEEVVASNYHRADLSTTPFEAQVENGCLTFQNTKPITWPPAGETWGLIERLAIFTQEQGGLPVRTVALAQPAYLGPHERFWVLPGAFKAELYGTA